MSCRFRTIFADISLRKLRGIVNVVYGLSCHSRFEIHELVVETQFLRQRQIWRRYTNACRCELAILSPPVLDHVEFKPATTETIQKKSVSIGYMSSYQVINRNHTLGSRYP